ncbi:hypothetical protein CDAR_599481 [Caerostris darwini]|uniref:Uncharacterized protein n=1 Tax=Caerostris darwini TaxID=1538125 RepID=A0AAV4NZQ5_9ARAC|nr:hypothetical protein CDAR_599481 [Caerostris darwini]
MSSEEEEPCLSKIKRPHIPFPDRNVPGFMSTTTTDAKLLNRRKLHTIQTFRQIHTHRNKKKKVHLHTNRIGCTIVQYAVPPYNRSGGYGYII